MQLAQSILMDPGRFMKKLLFILATLFSYNLMATTTTLACMDLMTNSQYILRISEDRSIIVYTPFNKNSSVLSRNNIVLDLKGSKSVNDKNFLYAGRNADQNIISLEVKKAQLTNGARTNVNVYYSENTLNLNYKTVFNCSVHIDTRHKGRESSSKRINFEFSASN